MRNHTIRREMSAGDSSEGLAERVHIRPMRLEDLPAVLRIEREAFSNPWHRGAFAAAIEEPDCQAIVGSVNDRLVGYAVSWFLREEVHIGNLAIAQTHRKKGIGSALLMVILEKAEQEHVSRVTLEVRASNEAAQRLYRGYGFSEVAFRRAYYVHPREDAVVMMKVLGGSKDDWSLVILLKNS